MTMFMVVLAEKSYTTFLKKTEMTKQEINAKAFRVYPKNIVTEFDDFGVSQYDMNEEERKGYIKALQEIEQLQKIKGWVARDERDGNTFIHPEKPHWNDTYRTWNNDRNEYLLVDGTYFDNLPIDVKPVEVELIVRRV